MRWPHESAITRRDEHLARTRKLSIWIAGGATAASFGLATALGYALPGHSVSSGTTSAPGTTSGSGSAQGTSGQGTGSGHKSHRRSGGIAPPQQPPSTTTAPPVVSSGGS